tara:strand:- start:600 stop:863 length:264 start_codon:yes stop_codon:yes gene_type:complete
MNENITLALPSRSLATSPKQSMGVSRRESAPLTPDNRNRRYTHRVFSQTSDVFYGNEIDQDNNYTDFDTHILATNDVPSSYIMSNRK